jgi:uncharacterized membrane protein YjgN (DUF898 family)
MRQNLEFRGSWTDIFGTLIVVVVLSTITFGIYGPWGYARMRRVILSRTYYQDQPLQFDGTGGQAFGLFLMVALLSLVTLGLYAILGFAAVRVIKWETEHTILPGGKRLEYRGSALDLFV